MKSIKVFKRSHIFNTSPYTEIHISKGFNSEAFDTIIRETITYIRYFEVSFNGFETTISVHTCIFNILPPKKLHK
ncbi:hypothetical protein Sjap_015087 [Stephania japonica]|uniref:Uncharacterized protein n=1 Tax=Stephania japonica TaxID=461633 RepID=A0AAP0NSI9_9MAGN